MARRALCPEVFQALGALPVRSSGSSDLNCGLIFRLQNLRLLKKNKLAPCCVSASLSWVMGRAH